MSLETHASKVFYTSNSLVSAKGTLNNCSDSRHNSCIPKALQS